MFLLHNKYNKKWKLGISNFLTIIKGFSTCSASDIDYVRFIVVLSSLRCFKPTLISSNYFRFCLIELNTSFRQLPFTKIKSFKSGLVCRRYFCKHPIVYIFVYLYWSSYLRCAIICYNSRNYILNVWTALYKVSAPSSLLFNLLNMFLLLHFYDEHMITSTNWNPSLWCLCIKPGSASPLPIISMCLNLWKLVYFLWLLQSIRNWNISCY